MTEREELKPCKCGCIAQTGHTSDGNTITECTVCDRFVIGHSDEQAFSMWNASMEQEG